MLQINQTLDTFDVAQALEGEYGKFEVTTPAGLRFIANCAPGHSLVSLRASGHQPTPFRIRKIADASASFDNPSSNS